MAPWGYSNYSLIRVNAGCYMVISHIHRKGQAQMYKESLAIAPCSDVVEAVRRVCSNLVLCTTNIYIISVYLYPITMATDNISGGNKSHARRVQFQHEIVAFNTESCAIIIKAQHSTLIKL